MEGLRKQFEVLQSRVVKIEERQCLPEVPEWAKEAVRAAQNTLGKDGTQLLVESEGGSLDFYRTLTVMHRKGIF